MYNTLVKSPGRTGSHLIIDHQLNNQNYSRMWSTAEDGSLEHLILHTQEPLLVHDHSRAVPHSPQDWCYIASVRQDIVAQTYSYYAACIMETWVGPYPRTELYIPRTINRAEFAEYCVNRAVFNRYCELLATALDWHSSYVIEWEDYKQDTQYLSKVLGGRSADRTSAVSAPAPDAKLFIENHAQLRTVGEAAVRDHEEHTERIAQEWTALAVQRVADQQDHVKHRMNRELWREQTQQRLAAIRKSAKRLR